MSLTEEQLKAKSIHTVIELQTIENTELVMKMIKDTMECVDCYSKSGIDRFRELAKNNLEMSLTALEVTTNLLKKATKA